MLLRLDPTFLAQVRSDGLARERTHPSFEEAAAHERLTREKLIGALDAAEKRRLELRAPQDGVVKELATTTVGAVVQPGTVLLTLVPREEPLVAEVYVRNQDVGFVREGQSVRIKLAAYPFTKYGILEGTVRTLSADASRVGGAVAAGKSPGDANETAPGAQSPFKALVELGRQELHANGLRLPIVAGMRIQAEVREGKRTVLEYLLSPVRQVTDEAGRER